jgi:hypothetical protein
MNWISQAAPTQPVGILVPLAQLTIPPSTPSLKKEDQAYPASLYVVTAMSLNYSSVNYLTFSR